MKLQYLAVIFLIIIMPIVMVLTQYIDYQVDAINMKHEYNTKLLDSTYDAIKAYQLNTVNNAISDISAEKIEGLEAAVKTFFNSLTTNFKYTGYNSSIMKDYVPAVVFTMYDGYYIYSPFENILTGVPSVNNDGEDFVDRDYANTEIIQGVKPYVYYSCRYVKEDEKIDVVITYTLDNYITIKGYVGGYDKGDYVEESGYLIDNIHPSNYHELKDGDGNYVLDNDGNRVKGYDYTFDGITFEYEKDECLYEYLGDEKYPCAKINGTKYYIDYKDNSHNNKNDVIFYISATGERTEPYKRGVNKEYFKKLEKYILNNVSAYNYYKEAYKLTEWVHENLGELTVDYAMDYDSSGNLKSIKDILGEKNYFSNEPIFGDGSTGAIHESDSNFNAHRASIIRYTIEKNLEAAITGYANYLENPPEVEFKMPVINDVDWDVLENNISIATFLQGFTIGGREYNEYCVVANNLTKEYVDENDIYILGNDNMYYKPNDKTLASTVDIAAISGYKPGIWKINFVRKNYQKELSDGNHQNYYYYPIRKNPTTPYLGSYSSVINSSQVNSENTDLYKYMKKLDSTDTKVLNLKTAYYTALARERWGQYSVNNDIDIVQGNILNPSTSVKIEKKAPIVTITQKPEETNENKWTNQDVTLVGEAIDEHSKITSYGFEPTGATINTTTNEDSHKVAELTVSESGRSKYTFYAKDEHGNEDAVSTIVYIDKEDPIISQFKIEEIEGKWSNELTLIGKIKDELSGIQGYVITRSEATPTKYNAVSDSMVEQEIQEKVLENGTYYLHVKDKAGNTTWKSVTVDNIDIEAPKIVVTPTNAELCLNTPIKIEISDDISGVQVDEKGQAVGTITLQTTIMEKINEDDEQEQEIKVIERYTYTAIKNENNVYEATITIGEKLTGIYKLYIGGDISDNAGNITKEQEIGEFIFDNQAPEIDSDINSKTVKITLSDSPAGLDLDTAVRKFYLSTSSEENTRTKSYDYKSEEVVELGQIETGKYYIWVESIEDKLGNATGEVCISEIETDSDAPTVTVDPATVDICKNIDVTITLKDIGSGLQSEEGTWYLSTSKTENNKAKYGTYTSGQKFNIGDGLTGKYYLWVADVSDKEGNVNKEHCVAEFTFDNLAPNISNFKQTGMNASSISVETSAVDSGEAGIGSYKYYILKPGATDYILSGENESTSTIDSYTYKDDLVAGKTYKLYVVVADKVGNVSKSEIIEVKLADNYMITTGTDKQFESTLADAVSASSNGSKITLLATIEDNSEVIIDNLSNLTFDLNGNTLTRNQSITITSSSSVEFVGEGFIKSFSYDNDVIINGGTCTINFEENSGIIKKGSEYIIHNTGNLDIKSGKMELNGGSIAILSDNNSNINMEDGKIIANNGIMADRSNVEIIINGGMIESGQRGIWFYYASGKLSVNGGNIKASWGNAIDIYNSSSTVEILGGNISGGNYGISGFNRENYYNIKDIIIGDKNKTYDRQSVIIEGGKYAISMSSTEQTVKKYNVYFYNGMLKTNTVNNNVLLEAYIQETREGFSIIDEKDSTSHYKYLTEVETDKMYAVENNLYSTLQEASIAAKTGDTIVLLKSGEDLSKVDFEDKAITLLLNSYTLTKKTNTIHIGNNASMTVTGNNATLNYEGITPFTISGEINFVGKINMTTTSSLYPLFDTNAENSIINIANGTLSANGNEARIVNLDNKSKCDIYGSTVITLNNGAYGIYNQSNKAEILLSGITINVYNSYAIYNIGVMECECAGSGLKIFIDNNSYGIYYKAFSSGNIIFNGDGIYKYHTDYNGKAIYNESSANVEIKGGTVNGIHNTSTGKITVEGGLVGDGIYNTSTGKITVEGGWVGDGIYNTSTGKITVEGGVVFGENYGIYNTGNTTIDIKGGKVYTYELNYRGGIAAIYNTNENAEIIIGDKTKALDTGVPTISNYISNITTSNKNNPAIFTKSNALYFNNGRIENTNATMYNVTPIVRYGYQIHKETSGDKYIEYLEVSSEQTEDTIPPTVEVTPSSSEVCKNKQITIKLHDEGSGLASTKGKYYLSSSSTTNYKLKSGTYTTNLPFTIGDGLTGTYYLWVGDVEDKAGNVNKEHYVGEFKFDNLAPKINNFKITASTTNTISVETLAVENGIAGLDKYEYYISTSENSIGNLVGENNSSSTKDTYTYTNLTVGTTYYVTVKVKDKVGNEAKSETSTIKLIDNYQIIIGTTELYRSTLADAVSASSNNSTIKVLNSLEDNSEVTIQNKSNLTIDLNGNTLTRSTTITITSTASVEFVGKGKINFSYISYMEDSIINAGNCIINFEQDSGIVGKNDVSNIRYGGTEVGYYYTSGVIHNSGTLIIKSGKLEQIGQGSVIKLDDNSILQIENGNIISQGYTAVEVRVGSDYDTSNISIIMNDGVIENIGQTTDAAKREKAYGNGIYFSWGYNKNTNITINGGKIISNNSSAIYSLNANPTIEIFGGLVSGKKNGIEVRAYYSSKYLPEVVIGNINNEYNKETVKVVGGQHAIYMNTEKFKAFNVYFYNGILKTTSIDNEVIVGAYIQEIRPTSTIIDEKDTTSHYKYLDKVDTDKMYAIENNLYSTLKEAVDASTTGDIIVLLKAGTDTSKVDFTNKDITLLLNNYKLTKTTNPINIGAGAKLTVTGNNATLTNTNIVGFKVTGKIGLYGKINISTTSSSYPIFDTEADNSVVDIHNGILKATGTAAKIINMDKASTCYIWGLVSITLESGAYGVYNSASGSNINLDGGNITVNNSYGVYNASKMNCVLAGTDMNINDSAYAIYNTNKSSGEMSSKRYFDNYSEIKLNKVTSMGIYNQSGSTISISFKEYMYIWSTVSGAYNNTNGHINTAIYNAGSGNILIEDGWFFGQLYGIQNLSSGNVTIKGGSISEDYYSVNHSQNWAGIYNTSTGKISVEGGYIYGINYGICNTGNTTISVKTGKVYVDYFDNVQGKYAIYNTNSNTQIIIGGKTSDINIEDPCISSYNTSNPAIQTNSNQLYFYNGRIENRNSKMYNVTPSVRYAYKIHKEKSGNTYIEYLERDLNIVEDRIEPAVTVTPTNSEVCKTIDVTIKLSDNENGSGLKSTNGTYYLSSSSTTNDKIKSGTYTSGTKFTIGNGLTGTYYLWVGDVEDKAGNVNKEHYMGKFIFDNLAPTINSFKITGSTINTISVETLAVDSGDAGLNKYEYYISTNQNSIGNLVGGNSSSSTTDTYTYTGLTIGNTYYLTVKVKDTVENETKSETCIIKLFDNYEVTTGTNKEYFSTLADAVAASSNNSTIKLMKSLEDSSEAKIDNLSDLTVNLNGYTLETSQRITITSTSSVNFVGKGFIVVPNAIQNGGKCILNFEEDYGIRGGDYVGLVNYGDLIMESGVIHDDTRSTGDRTPAILLKGNSTFTMNGGKILHYDTGIYFLDCSDSSFVMNGGTIRDKGVSNPDACGIFLDYDNRGAKITVNAGEIISNGNGAIVDDSNISTIKLLGGLISGNKYGVYFYKTSTNSEITVGNVKNDYTKEAVTIEGGQHAIYLNGRDVYFYNGLLRTKTINNDVLLGGNIKEVREGYKIVDEKDSTSHYKYLTPTWYYKEDSNGIKKIVTNGKQTLTLGDKVLYNPTEGLTANKQYISYKTKNGYGDQTFTLSVDETAKTKQALEWRVVGIDEDGNILIMPTTNIKDASGNAYWFTLGTDYSGGGTSEDDLLEGQAAAQYGAEEVNNVASIYGYGKGAAGARAIQVEDIHKIIVYDTDYYSGDEATYTKNATDGYIYIDWAGATTHPTKLTYKVFTYLNGNKWTTLENGQSVTLKSNNYNDYDSAEVINYTKYVKDISANLYDLLFKGTEIDQYYWLGTSYVQAVNRDFRDSDLMVLPMG